MLVYIGKRLLMLIPVLIGITIIVQILISVTPGDPAKLMLGTKATPEKVEELREELGLNDPIIVRYFRYMNGVFHGDFGKSYTTKRPVIEEMAARFPYTLRLVTIGLLLSLCIGVPIGVFAATHQYTWKDNLAMFFCLVFHFHALLLVRSHVDPEAECRTEALTDCRRQDLAGMDTARRNTGIVRNVYYCTTDSLKYA